MTDVAHDAFGRLRQSLPETLQDSRMTYDLAPLIWETVTTRRAVLSIRPAATFNSITNRSRIDPVTVSIYTDAAIYYEVIRGGTLGGSPSWASAGSNSAVEKDVAGTTVTNGDVVAAGYIATSGGAAKADARVTLTDNGLLPLPLALDSAGANPIVFSVVATSVSGTANVAASVQWTEIR